jgi:hypothetical protein
MKKTLISLLALTLLLTACADDDTTTTSGATRAEVTEVEFLYLESLPVQVRAVVRGNLPTPCHGLSPSSPERPADPRVVVEVTLTPPAADVVCAQVITPFEITIDLGSFAAGDWTLVLNGVEYSFTV